MAEVATIDDLERVKNLLVARLTDQPQIDGSDYPKLRRRIMEDGRIKEHVPKIVRVCRTLDESWPYMKTNLELPSYASRREYLRSQFEPALYAIESEPAPSTGVDSKESTGNYSTDLSARGFILEEKIGRGSSGSVYRAVQASLKRNVAVKFFDNPITSKNDEHRKRFHQEARMLALVQHPSIPYVLTTGMTGDVPYTVMEFIQGSTLRKVINQGPVEVERVLRIVPEVLNALSAVHSKGIVHRDVKPENVLLTDDEHVFLIDFSIGVCLEHVTGLTRVTKLNANTPGTPAYMAPEVLAGEEWDHRADLFSAGVVCFELLAGRPLISGALERELTSIPTSVAQVLARACSRAPEDRHGDAQGFANELANARVVSVMNPSLALCASHSCPGASWTSGFSPLIVEHTTARNCGKCGTPLVYSCESCGTPVDGKNSHCLMCGAELFSVPLCGQCSTPLSRKEITLGACDQCDPPF